MTSPNEKKKPGPPKSDDPPTVLSLKLPTSLENRVVEYAAIHGITKNEAGRRLLHIALSPIVLALASQPASGYNSRTGEFE